jgi:hypothetical protein
VLVVSNNISYTSDTTGDWVAPQGIPTWVPPLLSTSGTSAITAGQLTTYSWNHPQTKTPLEVLLATVIRSLWDLHLWGNEPNALRAVRKPIRGINNASYTSPAAAVELRII